jgi:hypothetical protein
MTQFSKTSGDYGSHVSGTNDNNVFLHLEINKLISNTSPGIVFTDKTKEKLLSDWMPGDGARTVRKKIINVINIIATDNQLDKDKKIYTIDHDEENDVYIISDVKNKCCAVME